MKLLVLDNSGWVFGTKLGFTRLMQEHFALAIPPAIKKEVWSGTQQGYRDAYVRWAMIEEGSVKVIEPDSKHVELVKTQTGLKQRGDIGVLAIAAQRRGIVYADDPHLESGCLILGIPMVSTASLLLHFYRKERLTRKQSFMLLDLLERLGYSPEHIHQARTMLER